MVGNGLHATQNEMNTLESTHFRVSLGEGYIPEPLFETTFTLLDSVMYSRISRGLGGLIFPPVLTTYRDRNRGRGVSRSSLQWDAVTCSSSRARASGRKGRSATTAAQDPAGHCTNVCTSTGRPLGRSHHRAISNSPRGGRSCNDFPS